MSPALSHCMRRNHASPNKQSENEMKQSAAQKHESRAQALIELLQSGTDVREEAWAYVRIVRNSRMRERYSLSRALSEACQAYEKSLKPKLTVIQGEAIISRPGRALLTLIVGGAA